MNENLLRQLAIARAAELPATVQEFPFGPEVDVFKVGGKIFMLIGTSTDSLLVTLKARPSDAVALCSAFANITPGYHMNKKHWVSVQHGSVPEDIFIDLITESYLLVVASLPKRLRPVDPDSFGQTPALR